MAAVHAVASAMPPDALLVDESNSAAGYVRALYTSNDPDGYRSCHHGGLGWAMPYAVGAKLAQPNRPVVCLLGDGSVHYSPQSLYTAAKLRLAVCFVVMNNSEYRLLRDKLVERSDGSRADTIIGMELDQPTVDFQHLASAYRVKSVKVAGADELAEAVKYALAADGPTLVDVATERG
jgi:benzoylformate decarboxylase